VVTAVDFSEGMLREARRKPGATAIRFLVHDLHEPLPFPDQTFDLVVSGLVLEHLRDLADARGAENARIGKGEVMARQIYVNLPVRNLKRSMEFFTRRFRAEVHGRERGLPRPTVSA
jgi:ubiquinone/menaquinone biosynthesis C-methylase UbiE